MHRNQDYKHGPHSGRPTLHVVVAESSRISDQPRVQSAKQPDQHSGPLALRAVDSLAG